MSLCNGTFSLPYTYINNQVISRPISLVMRWNFCLFVMILFRTYQSMSNEQKLLVKSKEQLLTAIVLGVKHGALVCLQSAVHQFQHSAWLMIQIKLFHSYCIWMHVFTSLFEFDLSIKLMIDCDITKQY